MANLMSESGNGVDHKGGSSSTTTGISYDSVEENINVYLGNTWISIGIIHLININCLNGGKGLITG